MKLQFYIVKTKFKDKVKFGKNVLVGNNVSLDQTVLIQFYN